MILSDLEYWKEAEHSNWKLLSFTDRTSARFGWLEHGESFERYVTVKRSTIEFLRGVDPDVLDQFMV